MSPKTAETERKEGGLKVVSVSLPERLVARIDETARSHGFRGRSDLIRAGVNTLFTALARETEARGDTTCTLTLHYDHDIQDHVARTLHEHQGIIRTLVHNHLASGDCLEMVVLEGDARRIGSLLNRLRGMSGVHVAEPVPLGKGNGRRGGEAQQA